MPFDRKKMKRVRETLRLSQDEAAISAGFRWSQQWSDLERGRQTNLTVKTLDRIAKALGVKAKDLLK